MLTLKAINKAIAAKGIKAELVKGEGYYYFVGDAVEYADTSSVPVYRLNHLSFERWLAELDDCVANSTARKLELDIILNP